MLAALWLYVPSICIICLFIFIEGFPLVSFISVMVNSVYLLLQAFRREQDAHEKRKETYQW